MSVRLLLNAGGKQPMAYQVNLRLRPPTESVEPLAFFEEKVEPVAVGAIIGSVAAAARPVGLLSTPQKANEPADVIYTALHRTH